MTSIICNIFGHRFGEWEYPAVNSCQQVRLCKRDNYQESRVLLSHEFGEWEYVNHDSCEQVKVCTRCSQRQEQISHQVENWKYISDRSCQQEGICQRCKEKVTRIEHDWEHIYDPGGDILGENNTKSGYTVTVYSEPVDYYRCKRCGETK